MSPVPRCPCTTMRFSSSASRPSSFTVRTPERAGSEYLFRLRLVVPNDSHAPLSEWVYLFVGRAFDVFVFSPVCHDPMFLLSKSVFSLCPVWRHRNMVLARACHGVSTALEMVLKLMFISPARFLLSGLNDCSFPESRRTLWHWAVLRPK